MAAIGPMFFAACLATVGAVLTAWATAVMAVARPGSSPKREGKALGLSRATGVVAFALGMAMLAGKQGPSALLGSLGVLAVAVVSAGATVVASARVAKDDRQHQGRVTGSREAVMVAASLAVVAAGGVEWTLGAADVFWAVACAAWETKADLLQAGLSEATGSLTAGLLLALVPLAAGFAGLSTILGRAHGRVAAGGAIGGAQVLVWLGARYVVHGVTVAGMTEAVARIAR